MGTKQQLRARRPWTAFVIALVGSIVLVSCGGGSSEDDQGSGATGSEASTGADEPTRGGTLRVAWTMGLTSADPVRSTNARDVGIMWSVLDPLTRFDPETGDASPWLARSWEYRSPTTLVLELEEGVRFHDGEAFDAEAVKSNLERTLTTEESPTAVDLAAIESIDVLGEYELQLNLNTPNATLPLVLSDRAGLMVSPAAAESAGDDFGLAPVGTGPFVFVSQEPGVNFIVERNEDYWREGEPYLDGIDFTFVSDPSAAVNSVIAGDNDLTFRIDPSELERLDSSQGVVVSTSSALEHYRFYFNLAHEPFDDVRVRQAMNYAIDREALAEGGTFGVGEPIWQALPEGHWAHFDEFEGYYEHDPERARELLAEAGLADGFSFSISVYDNAGDIRRAEIFKAQLAEVGIDVEIVPGPTSQTISAMFDEQTVDGHLGGFGGRPDPGQTLALLFAPDSYFNAGHHDDPEVVRLLEEGASAPDVAGRQEAYRALTEHILDQALDITTTSYPNIAAHRDNVHGFAADITGNPFLLPVWID